MCQLPNLTLISKSFFVFISVAPVTRLKLVVLDWPKKTEMFSFAICRPSIGYLRSKGTPNTLCRQASISAVAP